MLSSPVARRLGAGVLLAAFVALAGCAAERPALRDAAVTTDAPRPVGVEDPAKPVAADGDESCDPRASLRPTDLSGPTVARIRARGRLVAGVSQNAYQVGFRDPATGQLAGFEIDLVREIARDLVGSPDRVQFVALGAADRIPSLASGRVDLVMRTMTMTCRDWRQVAFSTEYFSAAQRLLVPQGSPVASMADLTAGAKVCAAAGSTSISNIAAHPGVVPVAVVEVIDCLILLQQRQVAAVSTSDILLAGLAAQDPTTVVVGPPIKRQPYGVAVAPGSTDLVRFVNEVLERVRRDGTWQASYRRWLSLLGPTPAPPPARYRP
jgi:polar amino acid transport system substrate-binding protein